MTRIGVCSALLYNSLLHLILVTQTIIFKFTGTDISKID
jgi:hypothetical protein